MRHHNIVIPELDLETQCSPFNGHLPFEMRQIPEGLREAERKLKDLLLRDGEEELLVFAEHMGRIYFEFGSDWPFRIKRYGQVPVSVQSAGETVIREYAQARMEQALAPFRAWRGRCEAYMRHPNVTVSTVCDGVTIRGTIIHADHRYFKMNIEEPFVVADVVGGGFGWASAMAGHFMFDDWDYNEFDLREMRLSKRALESAEEELVRRFQAHRYASKYHTTQALVAGLNKDGGR